MGNWALLMGLRKQRKHLGFMNNLKTLYNFFGC